MELTNDQLGHIKSLGILVTPIEDIPILLDISMEKRIELIKDLKDVNSPIYQAYHSGVVKGRVGIKREFYDKAKKGDSFAREELSKIQEEEKIANLSKELFNI